MSRRHLTEEDAGKRVVSKNGSELGMIAEVRDGIPYVETNPDVVEKAKAQFDWGEPADETYPLETVDVAEITDDEVRLQ